MAIDFVCLRLMSVLSLGLIETRGLVAAIEAADAAAKAAQITLLSAELLGGGIVTLRMQGELGAVQAAVEAGAQAAKRIGEVVAVRVIPRPVPELRALSPLAKYQSAPGELPSVATGSHVQNNRPIVGDGAQTDPHRVSKPAPSRTKVASTSLSRTMKPSELARESSVAETPRSPEPPAISLPTYHSSPATLSRPHHDFSELEAMPVARLRQYARSVRNLGIQGRQISMANKTQLLDAIRQAGTRD